MSFWHSRSLKALFALSSVLPFLLAATEAIIAPLPNSHLLFSDTREHWANGCIEGISREGLMKGYPDGKFRPSDTMTRAEFAAVMVKAFPNAPVIRDDPNFSDVPADFWGWRAIKSAYRKGFLTGYPGNLFEPAQTINRAQALIVIANAQNRPTQQTTAAADAAVLNQYFEDARSIPTYARPGIAAATRTGLVVNYPQTDQLKPNDSITRGEATALLCRLNEDGSDARYYIATPYIAAFGDSFDTGGMPEATEQSKPILLETQESSYANNFLTHSLKAGSQLLFILERRWKDPAEIWQTDGTAAGTQLIQSLDSNSDSIIGTDRARFIGASEERMWLLTNSSSSYNSPSSHNLEREALWSRDRTTGTMQEVADFSPALAEALGQAKYIYRDRHTTKALNERIPLFLRTEQDIQLWMTDGKSSAGTQQIGAFSTNFIGNQIDLPQQLTTTDSYVFFVAAAQPDVPFSESVALWRTDGTPEGTIPLQTMGSINREEAVFVWNNYVYFTATTPEAGRELWVSDGTQQGTRLLKDFYPGAGNSEVSIIGTTDVDLFILANSLEYQGLWATSGSPDSIRLVKQLGNPAQYNRQGIIYPSDNKRLFFKSSNGMWVTDGAEDGTQSISVRGRFGEAIIFKDRLFFNNTSIDGEELWVSSGAGLEPYQLADLTPGEYLPTRTCRGGEEVTQGGSCIPGAYAANNTSPRNLTVVGDYLYFMASGDRLFRTDGTVGGTALVAGGGKDRVVALATLDEHILFVTNGDFKRLWAITDN